MMILKFMLKVLLLSGLFWIVAIAGYLTGVCTGHESLQMLAVAFAAFLIPHICCWLIERIISFRFILGKFMRS